MTRSDEAGLKRRTARIDQLRIDAIRLSEHRRLCVIVSRAVPVDCGRALQSRASPAHTCDIRHGSRPTREESPSGLIVWLCRTAEARRGVEKSSLAARLQRILRTHDGRQISQRSASEWLNTSTLPIIRRQWQPNEQRTD